MDISATVDWQPFAQFVQQQHVAVQGGNLARALGPAAQIVLTAARAAAPVQSGRLRDSIGVVMVVGGLGATAFIGTTVVYAAAQEFGWGTRPPHPYLRPVMYNQHDALVRAVGDSAAALVLEGI